MIIKITSLYNEKDFDFEFLRSLIELFKNLHEEPFQIHTEIHKTNWNESVLEHFDVESLLNGTHYIHYVYVSVQSKTSSQIFLMATLLKNICELLDYEIELFAKKP